jgi:hypothetical protein
MPCILPLTQHNCEWSGMHERSPPRGQCSYWSKLFARSVFATKAGELTEMTDA